MADEIDHLNTPDPHADVEARLQAALDLPPPPPFTAERDEAIRTVIRETAEGIQAGGTGGAAEEGTAAARTTPFPKWATFATLAAAALLLLGLTILPDSRLLRDPGDQPAITPPQPAEPASFAGSAEPSLAGSASRTESSGLAAAQTAPEKAVADGEGEGGSAKAEQLETTDMVMDIPNALAPAIQAPKVKLPKKPTTMKDEPFTFTPRQQHLKLDGKPGSVAPVTPPSVLSPAAERRASPAKPSAAKAAIKKMERASTPLGGASIAPTPSPVEAPTPTAPTVTAPTPMAANAIPTPSAPPPSAPRPSATKPAPSPIAQKRKRAAAPAPGALAGQSDFNRQDIMGAEGATLRATPKPRVPAPAKKFETNAIDPLSALAESKEATTRLDSEPIQPMALDRSPPLDKATASTDAFLDATADADLTIPNAVAGARLSANAAGGSAPAEAADPAANPVRKLSFPAQTSYTFTVNSKDGKVDQWTAGLSFDTTKVRIQPKPSPLTTSDPGERHTLILTGDGTAFAELLIASREKDLGIKVEILECKDSSGNALNATYTLVTSPTPAVEKP